MTTFISIGNARQSFTRLLDGILENLNILPQPTIVQCGHTRFLTSRCTISKFYNLDQYNHLLESSPLLILHAGGGSIIKALRLGKRPVVMPRRKKYHEHTSDHQFAWAIELNKMGLIELALEKSDLNNAIQRALNYLPSGNSVVRNDYAIKTVGDTIRHFDSYFRIKSDNKQPTR